MNNYKEYSELYLSNGISVIPDKYKQKIPAIKGWTEYCDRLPNNNEVAQWSTIGDTNIAVCTGKASGLVALDFDCTDPKIIEAINVDSLPKSPVERIGAKGFVRFFKYNGEKTFTLKHAGGVILEILSENKKVTIPPSIHPSGMGYKWTGPALHEVNLDDLPTLPPIGWIELLQARLSFAFPESELKGGKIINGRNDSLSSECGKLIREGVAVDAAIAHLIQFDKDTHESPLFEDLTSFGHTEPFSNALAFYSNHLQTVNNRRLKDQKEYEIPITASAVNHEYKEEVLKKKEQKQDLPKKANVSLPEPMGTLKEVRDLILENSYVKQPELALSASLVLMSTVMNRKFEFMGNVSNLYLLNVSNSGTGKEMPQKVIKDILYRVNPHLMGAGDYVSDAALVDSFATQKSRLDVIDEASGLLKSATAGGESYNGKMAEILCELYTSSNSIYMGRRLANNDLKGECERPFVSMLMSTTPTGFSESVNQKAIDKGLLGRVLVFQGRDNAASTFRVKSKHPSESLIQQLQHWSNYIVPKQAGFTSNTSVDYLDVPATEKAMELLEVVFTEYDKQRVNGMFDDKVVPVAARRFQQLCKIAMIHAASRLSNQEIEVDGVDIQFAYKVINYNFDIFQNVLQDNIYESDWDRKTQKIYNYIELKGVATKAQIWRSSKLKPNEKKTILEDLIDSGKVVAEGRKDGKIQYRAIKHES